MDKKQLFCVGICVVLTISVIYLLSIKGKVKEGFDPQDMGGRKYFGFGREYGYSVFDMEGAPEICYQTTPEYVCMPGYNRKRNYKTGQDQCCVNGSNY
jgi:hypothetical protein